MTVPADRRKQQAVELIRREAGELRPGVWLIASSGVACHWREHRLPAFLQATRPNVMARRRGIRGALGRWWHTLQPPFLVCVGPGTGRYSILLAGKGGPLLMDPDAGVVLRRGVIDAATDEVIETRRALSRFIDVPAFEVVEGGVREALIPGRHLSQLTRAERVGVWRSLVRGYTGLARECGRDNGLSLLQGVLDRMRDLHVPAELDQILRGARDEVLRWAESLALVPSHGDLSDDNLIVQQDGAPCLIDFEPRCVGRLPHLHDPVLLAVREAKRGRSDMLEFLLSGVAGQGDPATADDLAELSALRLPRVAVLTSITLHTYLRSLDQGVSNRERWAEHLMSMWRPVSRHFA